MPRARSPLGRFVRNPQTGEIVVAQAPNVPLWIFIAATAGRLAFHPSGSLGRALSITGSLALVLWALLEIARGASPFRRVLGAAVLAFVIVGALTR